MNAGAATALLETMKEQGLEICNTPRMVEVLLTQKLRTWPAETKALAAACNLGYVKELIAKPKIDLKRLTPEFAKAAGLTMPMANWTISTWSNVIAEIRTGKPAGPAVKSWNDLQLTGDIGETAATDRRKVFLAVLVVGLIGGIAGGIPGFVVGQGLSQKVVEADLIRSQMQQAMKITSGSQVGGMEFAAIFGTMGAIGGLAGAGIGLMGGLKAITPAKLIGGGVGAIGAYAGSLCGMVTMGPLGTLFGSMLCSLIPTATFARAGVLIGVVTMLVMSLVLNFYFGLFGNVLRTIAIMGGG